MSPERKYRVGDREIPGQEIEFKTEKEEWNVYILLDGTKLKLKPVVAKIVRLNEYKPDGEPLYLVNASNVIVADVPEELMKKPS